MRPNSSDEEEKKSEDSDEEDDDDEDDFGDDRDTAWDGAIQRKKSPMRGKSKSPRPKVPAAAKNRISFDETLQTIAEAQSDAENTFANTKKRATTPGNGQDAPIQTQPSEDSDDREDMVGDDSTEASSNNQQQEESKNNFTFMNNDPENASVLEQISKFTSVEQYREFLEKELGEEKLMKAYPMLKEFVSNADFNFLGRLNFVLRKDDGIGEDPLWRPHNPRNQEVPTTLRNLDIYGTAS